MKHIKNTVIIIIVMIMTSCAVNRNRVYKPKHRKHIGYEPTKSQSGLFYYNQSNRTHYFKF